MGEGIVRRFQMDMYTLLYLKWIINKDLRYSTGDSAQMLCGSLDGRGVWGRMDTCMAGVGVHVSCGYICMAETFHCSPETITTSFTGYTPL